MKRQNGLFWISILIVALFISACDTGPKLHAEVFSSIKGGFEYQIPVDYEQEENYGFVQILAPGADTDTGPVYMLMGGTNEGTVTIEDLQTQMEENWDFDEYTKPKNTKIGGYPGLQTDFSVDDSGTLIEGRIIIVLVSPTQQFVMLGGATPELWKDEVKVFTKILGSIKFFKLNLDVE